MFGCRPNDWCISCEGAARANEALGSCMRWLGRCLDRHSRGAIPRPSAPHQYPSDGDSRDGNEHHGLADPESRGVRRAGKVKYSLNCRIPCGVTTMAGQILPDVRRTRARSSPIAGVVMRNRPAEAVGWSPEAYTPPRIRGMCQQAQTTPLRRSGNGAPASINRVSIYPRQPISSPAAARAAIGTPIVRRIATRVLKAVRGALTAGKPGTVGDLNWTRPAAQAKP